MDALVSNAQHNFFHVIGRILTHFLNIDFSYLMQAPVPIKMKQQLNSTH
jgi:hypothetical protein